MGLKKVYSAKDNSIIRCCYLNSFSGLIVFVQNMVLGIHPKSTFIIDHWLEILNIFYGSNSDQVTFFQADADSNATDFLAQRDRCD